MDYERRGGVEMEGKLERTDGAGERMKREEG